MLPAKITLLLMHLTRAGMDRALALERTETGDYRGEFAPLAPGRWHVRPQNEDWRLWDACPFPGPGWWIWRPAIETGSQAPFCWMKA